MKLNRRNFLKTNTLTLTAMAINTPLFSKSLANEDIVIGHNNHKYKVIKGWGVLDAGKNPVNDCHEMVEDSKGRLIMCTNETKNNIIIYDKSGKLLETWGTKYPGAHGLTIAGEKSDQFLLLTDTERKQVLKLDLKGREIYKWDYPKESGVYDAPNRFTPTETAVNPANGDVYIADGYGSNYITQFDSNGKFIRVFGGTGEDNDKFQCCHGIVVDTRDSKNPTLLITDRVHNALKRFTLDGKYLQTYELPGTYICRPVLVGDFIYGAAFRSGNGGWSNSGYIQILDKNMKVVSTPGGSEPIYKEGKLQRQYKDDPNQVFMHPHDVHVDADGNIYVPQWASQKTYPVKLQRI